MTKKSAKVKARPKSKPKPKPKAIVKREPEAMASAEDELLEPRLPDPALGARDALTRLRSIETLEDSYLAWCELRTLHAQAEVAYGAERERIEGQGEFLLGAVRVARNLGAPSGSSPALAKGQDVDAFIAQASARLDAARGKLKLKIAGSESQWAKALAEAQRTVVSRVERTAQHAKPALRLLLRSLAGNRRILHLERLTGDASVLVHQVLTGRVPSRYDYLFDDWTDDVAQTPASLYAEEGAGKGDVRCGAPRAFELLSASSQVFPSKGMIPFMVQQPAASLHGRFLQRGPVAEAEVQDGEGWRSVLSTEEAETIAGWLIKLQLEGKLTVTLARG